MSFGSRHANIFSKSSSDSLNTGAKRPGGSSSSRFLYFERQDSLLCGQHCLNNLTQGPVFTAASLADVAYHLDSQEAAVFNDHQSHPFGTGPPSQLGGSSNVDDRGNFSIQVLEVALQQVCGISLERVANPVQLESFFSHARSRTSGGFIVNRSEHWFAYRFIHQQWFDLNSNHALPRPLAAEQLKTELLNMLNSGHSVFQAYPMSAENSTADSYLASEGSSPLNYGVELTSPGESASRMSTEYMNPMTGNMEDHPALQRAARFVVGVASDGCGWYRLEDVLQAALSPIDESSAVEKKEENGFKSFTGQGSRLGDSENTTMKESDLGVLSAIEIEELAGAIAISDGEAAAASFREEMELARAIAMSAIEPTVVTPPSKDDLRAKRLAALEKRAAA